MLAWQVVRIYAEALHRKKLPDLAALLRRGKPATPQTIAEQRAALATLSETYGIPLRQGGRIVNPMPHSSRRRSRKARSRVE